MVDDWCDNEKGVGKTAGIWWKGKEDISVKNVNIAVIYVNMKIKVVFKNKKGERNLVDILLKCLGRLWIGCLFSCLHFEIISAL